MASEVEPWFIFLAIKFSSFVNCLLIFLTFFFNWTVCLFFVCLTLSTYFYQGPKQIQIMAFLCSRLPMSSLEHALWMASELKIKFSPLYSAPPSLPTSPSTASLQTPELQPNAHNSLHPRLLQVPSPTPGRLTSLVPHST